MSPPDPEASRGGEGQQIAMFRNVSTPYLGELHTHVAGSNDVNSSIQLGPEQAVGIRGRWHQPWRCAACEVV